MSALLDSLLTPQQRAQAERIDAAMAQLSGLLAERAVLNTAGQALDASRRAAFEAMTNNTQAAPNLSMPSAWSGLCSELRAEVEAEDDDPVCASDAAMEVAGRADRAFQAGNRAAAADLYRTAAQMLVTAAEVAEAL